MTPLVTIFTPTFNRAYRLPELYNSLLRQRCKDFEWIVVDDGSTDNTEKLFERWLREAPFAIYYTRQNNGGKHRAINRGVEKANGLYFFIVDSDDSLTDDAVEQIANLVPKAEVNPLVCGMCFRRINVTTKEIIGPLFPEDEMLASSLDMVYKYKVGGDKAEVISTKVLRCCRFPEIKGENFVPEALIWNRIADKYKMICVNIGIYLCEYLPDGLSANFKKNLKRNPKGFGLYYKETMKRRISFKVTLKNMLRTIQCHCYSIIEKN